MWSNLCNWGWLTSLDTSLVDIKRSCISYTESTLIWRLHHECFFKRLVLKRYVICTYRGRIEISNLLLAYGLWGNLLDISVYEALFFLLLLIFNYNLSPCCMGDIWRYISVCYSIIFLAALNIQLYYCRVLHQILKPIVITSNGLLRSLNTNEEDSDWQWLWCLLIMVQVYLAWPLLLIKIFPGTFLYMLYTHLYRRKNWVFLGGAHSV